MRGMREVQVLSLRSVPVLSDPGCWPPGPGGPGRTPVGWVWFPSQNPKAKERGVRNVGSLVPLAIFVYLALLEGQKGANRFDPNPKEEEGNSS